MSDVPADDTAVAPAVDATAADGAAVVEVEIKIMKFVISAAILIVSYRRRRRMGKTIMTEQTSAVPLRIQSGGKFQDMCGTEIVCAISIIMVQAETRQTILL